MASMNENRMLRARGHPEWKWNYTDPAPLGEKLLLLTTGGTCVVGSWAGMKGDMYLAWQYPPKRDKEKEKEIYDKIK